MTVFYREGKGWCAKFVARGKQRWVRGGPFETREEAERAEAKHRNIVTLALDYEKRMERRSLPHTVYRLFAGDELVYVGITVGGLRRLGEHARRKKWWTEVTHATFEHVENADQAEFLEADLIAELKPRYNRLGKRMSRNGSPATAEGAAT